MKRPIPLILLVVLIVLLCSTQAFAVDFKKGSAPRPSPTAGELAIRVELVGERAGVYAEGKSISVSFNTSRDAYVVIYNIDAEGYVHLLFPVDGRPVRTEGRKTYFLPEPGSGLHWETGGETGVEYIHALAVEDAGRLDEDELYFLSTSERLSDEKRLRVDLDPHLAFNMIDEEIVRNADSAPPATDYTYFYVNRRVDYPRYICAKCHSPGAISDPYAMECPEVVIDRIAYADEPRYPYQPLYDIRYADEIPAESYSTTDYDDEWYENDDSGEIDTKVYLSFSFGSFGHPWYSAWPYYGGSFIGWGLYPIWDPFWGGFYWNIWWNDYYWWPYSYGRWWRYPYWPYCHYPWHYGDYWYSRYPGAYRRVYGDRNVVKRSIDYGTTYAKLTRERSLDGSRLIKTRQRAVADRLERSDLRRRTIERNPSGKTYDVRERGGRGDQQVDRASEGRTAGRDRGVDRSTTTKSGNRSRQTIDRRTTRTIRGDSRRETQKTREVDRARSGVKPNQPDRRSKDTERSARTPSRSSETVRSKNRTKSNRSDEKSVDRRRASIDGRSRLPVRSARAVAPPRRSSSPAQSASRSSPTPSRSASGRTSGSSGKTRSR